MKAYWLPAAALHGVWELLPHVEAPFLMPAWWERAPFPYGAIVMEDEKGPTALIPKRRISFSFTPQSRRL